MNTTHHGDGIPGGVVLAGVHGIKDLHRTLHSKGYRFLHPGVDPGPGEGVLSTELSSAVTASRSEE